MPAGARSPWGQRTDWPAVVEAAAHPTDCPPYHPWRRYDPASNTYCPSLPAGRQGTETVVAAVASGVVPDAWHMVHRHYRAVPCHEGLSDRIDSRRPYKTVLHGGGTDRICEQISNAYTETAPSELRHLWKNSEN